MAEIKILTVEPMQPPKAKTIDASLEAMQNEVGGYIEMIYPFDDPSVALVCNEEGKISGLPLNRCLRDEDGDICEVIAGTFFISASEDGTSVSLTDRQLKTYSNMFRFPEYIFFDRSGHVQCYTKNDDKDKAKDKKNDSRERKKIIMPKAYRTEEGDRFHTG